MLSRITHDIRHRRLFPMFVNLLVAFLASLRTHVARSVENAGLLFLLFRSRAAQVADVQNQPPACKAVLFVGIAPRGHAGEPNSIFDDVVDLTVAEILSLW